MILLVVRVKLRVKTRESEKDIELTVLANGGAESPRPCLAIGLSTAKELGVWPPKKAEVFSVEEASHVGNVYLIRNAVVLELLDEKGNKLSDVEADLAIQIGLTEPLITDVTIDALGIQVISFGKGLWRHIKDPLNVIRKSAKSYG